MVGDPDRIVVDACDVFGVEVCRGVDDRLLAVLLFECCKDRVERFPEMLLRGRIVEKFVIQFNVDDRRQSIFIFGNGADKTGCLLRTGRAEAHEVVRAVAHSFAMGGRFPVLLEFLVHPGVALRGFDEDKLDALFVKNVKVDLALVVGYVYALGIDDFLRLFFAERNVDQRPDCGGGAAAMHQDDNQKDENAGSSQRKPARALRVPGKKALQKTACKGASGTFGAQVGGAAGLAG